MLQQCVFDAFNKNMFRSDLAFKYLRFKQEILEIVKNRGKRKHPW